MKIIKKLLISSLVCLPLIASASELIDFNTSPAPLAKVVPKEAIGKAINYKDLTEFGNSNYKREIQYIEEGKWNYFNNSSNVLIATNKNNEIGIVKVHYSFKDVETIKRYRASLSNRYPEYKQKILEKDKITISKRKPFNVDYSTYESYLKSLILEAETELSAERLRIENNAFYIDINMEEKTSVETYIDFKIAPQWPVSVRNSYINDLKNIKETMNKELKHTPTEILDSKSYMEEALKQKSIHIF